MSRGTHLQKAWEELKKGGKAPPIAAIFDYLEDDQEMLSREEVLSRIHSYFSEIINLSVDDVTGEEVYIWTTAPTKSGLSKALGIDNTTLANYCNGVTSSGRPLSDKENPKRRVSNEDIPIIRKAIAVIESYYETSLTNGRNPTGAIFWLLNRDSAKWTNDHNKTITIEHTRRQTPEDIAERHNIIIDSDAKELPTPEFLADNGGDSNA